MLPALRSLVARAIKIAGAMFVKERERLIDEMLVERLSHVVLDIARHADENRRCRKRKDR